jgi:hypothetical protein
MPACIRHPGGMQTPSRRSSCGEANASRCQCIPLDADSASQATQKLIHRESSLPSVWIQLWYPDWIDSFHPARWQTASRRSEFCISVLHSSCQIDAARCKAR